MNEVKRRFYTIGELSKIVQVNSETIRYYEKINLIPKPSKYDNGYKKYSEMYVYRLKLIKKAKSFGFTLKEISDFFSNVLNVEDEGVNITNAIYNKLEEIELKILELNQKKELLSKFQDEVKMLRCPVLDKVIEENKKSS